MVSGPIWDFPPSSGGLHYDLSDAASAHFQTDRIGHLIREAIQNSLDARDTGFPSVHIQVEEIVISPDAFGGFELGAHLDACLQESRQSLFSNSELETKLLERAVKVVRSRSVRCLSIVDSGTTGLRPDNWRALVESESSVMKGSGSPGGSKGIGKSAALTVSDLLTVFYSTRYLAGRKGRVELAQGRSRLMTHPDPKGDGGEYLQHVGFYRNRDRTPLRGLAIPDCFRLKDGSGTGVFILGYNPGTDSWVDRMERAICANFFHAIAERKLTVQIKAENQKAGRSLDYQNLDSVLESHADSHSISYYRVVRDGEPRSVSVKQPLGDLRFYLTIGKGPSRLAYLNRNGMLITDKRDQSVNPFAPRRRGFWGDFTAVVIAGSDEGDRWIRTMEDPAHESINASRLQSESEQNRVVRLFADVRKKIRAIIESEMENLKENISDNLSELAGVFPEEVGEEQNDEDNISLSRVRTRLEEPSDVGVEAQSSLFDESQNDNSADGEGSSDSECPGGSENTDERASGTAVEGSRRERDRNLRLDRPKIFRTAPRRVHVSFGVEPDSSEVLGLSLRPRGQEPGVEAEIDLLEAIPLTEEGLSCSLHSDGKVVRVLLDGEGNGRVRLALLASASLEEIMAFDLRVWKSPI